MASNPKQIVIVRLEVVNDAAGELHQTRVIKLDSTNNYSVRIGRGSRSGSRDLYPSDSNAWFESRVMSRDHAILRAEPSKNKVYIEDVGSMHGTYVEGTKLQKDQPKLVSDGAELLFGAEVSRGPETFPALQIDVFYDFEDNNSHVYETPIKTSPADIIMWSGGCKDEQHVEEHVVQRDPSHISRNSFSVPDYDSEDYDSEAEQPPREIARKIEVVIPPRNADVPESDLASGGSMMSDDDDTPYVYEPWNRTHCNTFESTEARNSQHSADTKNDLKNTEDTPEKKQADQSFAKASLKTTPQRMEMQSSMTVGSTQGPMTKGSDHYTNLTDEDESDYGDDISADLFDNDLEFEDYQKPERQLDNSSFSSQSPILTSLPSKIELAAAPEPAKPAPAQVVAAEPQPDQVSKTDAPRAPSPSDAAMPKAKATTRYPFAQPPNYPSQSYATEPATETSIYGYPVQARHQPVSSRNSDWCAYTPEGNYGVPETYRQVYTNATDYWPTSQPTYYYSPFGAGSYPCGYSSLPIKPIESASKPLETVPAPAPVPTSSFVTLKATPRVAIRDLVEEPQPVREPIRNVGTDNVASQSSSGHQLPEMRTSKRKADQISDADMPASTQVLPKAAEITEMASVTEEQDAQFLDSVAPTTDSFSQTASLQPISKSDEARGKTVLSEAQQKSLVADGVVKFLKSDPQNQALVTSTADVIELLAGNTSYAELCTSFETRGFKFDRRGLAKSLFDSGAVPSRPGLKLASASASTTSVGEVPGPVEEGDRPKKKARSNFYKYAATAASGFAIGAVGAVAALVALPPDFFV